MVRAKGFTLTELIMVVAVIAILVVAFLLVVGRIHRDREIRPGPLCGANLNGIGKGIWIYQSENNDCLPWIDSTDWSSTTGTNAESISTPTKVSPTAIMFLIIRSGQPVDIFRCPRDDNATKMSSTRNSSGDYYWDFYDDTKGATAADHCKKVSYSYQAPLYDPAGKSYSSGYTANSKGGLAIMADKTPGFNGKTPCTNWAGTLTEKQRKSGMSQNHDSGDFINVLYADAHVKKCKRADVGIGDDNIYSASNNAAEGTQGAGSTTLTHHLSEDDSFLIGPIK
ncbi:MAG: prepilin-type N-terminal cleavage/methylation domain-containing protein [Phycisphaerae bacterium]|nr:prepilin-type N-terminal cleavage/methylation domain-containing protein [Phycisphaerae bacterium]